MNRLRAVRAVLCFLMLLQAPRYWAGESPFRGEVERQGFLKALREMDGNYDPKDKMLRAAFSSPGYHTTLKGGTVHRTRESLAYAVALLDSGEPERLARAQEVLRRVIALQDQDPKSRTYGIWSWFLEEPLEKMSPPDWNWADFCGTPLLEVARDHMDRLEPALREQVKASILHAARSIQRRDVGPGYTNIAVMGTYVTLVAGEFFGVAELADYGKARLKRFYEFTREHGSFAEYNSPTYSIVAIREISRMCNDVRDPKSQEMLVEINHMAWSHVARHFHPPTRQWAGPHSRCYRTLLGETTLGFIQQATGGKARFLADEAAALSIDVHRIRAQCPDDLVHFFTSLPKPRLEREQFQKAGKDSPATIGTTWLHPLFTIGSVNVGDFWNQRRPLIAYWRQGGGVAALRARCLHDGYDFASGRFFSVQDDGDVLGALVFATDGGDRHPSLDRVKDATIQASDLRFRFQLEGQIGEIALPKDFRIDRAVRLELGDVTCDLKVAMAGLGEFPISAEVSKEAEAAGLDVVLYKGERRALSFGALSQAAVVFAISMGPKSQRPSGQAEAFVNLSVAREADKVVASWQRPGKPPMVLSVPSKPGAGGKLRVAASGRLGEKDAWGDMAQP